MDLKGVFKFPELLFGQGILCFYEFSFHYLLLLHDNPLSKRFRNGMYCNAGTLIK